MEELLNLILQNITTHPDDVSITISEEDGREVYTISVHPEDMGRVIGKNGKVIQAIRSLAHVIAIRQNKRFRVNVAESGDGELPESPREDAQTATEETPMEEAPTEVNPAEETVVQTPVEEVDEKPVEDDLISGAIDLSEDAKE